MDDFSPPETISEEMDPFYEPQSYRKEEETETDPERNGDYCRKLDICQLVGVCFLFAVPLIIVCYGAVLLWRKFI